jgi:prevent-host-death family protein
VKSVNVHEAKTHLSRLLNEVAAGKEIIISKAGKPVAKLVPLSDSRRERSMGMDRGRAWISEDFDAPLPDDLLAMFEGADPS